MVSFKITYLSYRENDERGVLNRTELENKFMEGEVDGLTG
jgi:hypothetical protein